jgi:hypothetical protein
MIAIVRIGRMDSRPIYERLAGGKNEAVAQQSMQILDELNSRALASKPATPEPVSR